MLRAELRDFLITRRAKIDPRGTGLIVDEVGRKVDGLRREEVARLAGISVEYYTRLERGQAVGASPSVVRSVARALQLDDAERGHLHQLLAALGAGECGPVEADMTAVRPEVGSFLDAMTDLPALLINRFLDIVLANELGRGLYEPVFAASGRLEVNIARFVFQAQNASRKFYQHWDTVADRCAGMLRLEVARRPHDRSLAGLIKDLRQVDDFRGRWAEHDVVEHDAGVSSLLHPVLGPITLPYENLHLAADPDLLILAYNPQPGTAAHAAIQRLKHSAGAGLLAQPHPA